MGAHIWAPGRESFSVAEGGATDLLLHHASRHREIDDDPLNDPNRHTRIQTVGWNPDGTLDFGVLVADTVKESA
ncbi:family 43 glycosylhydrolase [Streptomyces sp. NPDC001858]